MVVFWLYLFLLDVQYDRVHRSDKLGEDLSFIFTLGFAVIVRRGSFQIIIDLVRIIRISIGLNSLKNRSHTILQNINIFALHQLFVDLYDILLLLCQVFFQFVFVHVVRLR